MNRFLRMAAILIGAALLPFLATGTAFADIPICQVQSGNMTWYNDAGYGSCGTQIDANSQLLVAVSSAWWTTANPNNDPLCNSISVQVEYQGKTITVPVKDKCPSCSKTHIDLSRSAFAKLADLNLGNVSGITWKFIRS